MIAFVIRHLPIDVLTRVLASVAEAVTDRADIRQSAQFRRIKGRLWGAVADIHTVEYISTSKIKGL